MRYFSEAIDDLDLVDAMYTRAETTVNAKYLVVDHNTQREKVEHVCEVVPDIGVTVFSLALGVEAVGLGHTP